jgi:hypothetical protein
VADASWLLECSLPGGAEIMAGNRRGYQISITGGVSPSQFLVFFPAEAVVDAELGVLLRLTCYVDGKPRPARSRGTSSPGRSSRACSASTLRLGCASSRRPATRSPT